jgi:hypothetical protein
MQPLRYFYYICLQKFLISHLLRAFTMRLPGTFQRNQQLLLLVLHEEEEDDNKPDRFKMLLDEEGCCRDCCLPRMTLLLPTKETTPWQKLYASGHDPALITVTGLDYECFGELLQLFQPYFNDFTPNVLGWLEEQPCRLLQDSILEIGVTLHRASVKSTGVLK